MKPGSEIRFADGFDIVLGRNGTGKTTLLDLISRIVRWDFRDIDREDLRLGRGYEQEKRRTGHKPGEEFCVAKMHNLESASRGFPARVAYEIQKSFFASVEHMKACSKLVTALQSTIDTWS